MICLGAHRSGFLVALAALALTACARVDFDRTVAKVNAQAADFTQGRLSLARDSPARAAMAQRASELLSALLTEPAAVELALVNSPGFQSLLARRWAAAAEAAQSGRIANPVFGLERIRLLGEVEYSRLLTVHLSDLLTFPWRQEVAQARMAAEEARLIRAVVIRVTEVRQAWTRAVAAGERLSQAIRVRDAAEASAELARRMQEVGNLNAAERLRQQSFYAEAAIGLALARHAAKAEREALIRRLGLSETQVAQLVLPERLPDLPPAPRTTSEVTTAVHSVNLDLQLAQADFRAAAKAQGLRRVTDVLDVELGGRRETVSGPAEGAEATGHGYELALTLPLFDGGGLKREAMSARTLAAAHDWETALRDTASRLRESYSAYRTAYDIARHYRQEVIPLHQLRAEENALRYSGMLIGIFELLAGAGEQARAVAAGIDALEQFWLADAALQAVMMGTGQGAAVGSPGAPETASDRDH